MTEVTLEKPQLNIISKIDLIREYGDTRFPLEFYLTCSDLAYLKESIQEGDGSRHFYERHKALIDKCVDIIDKYSELIRLIQIYVLQCL